MDRIIIVGSGGHAAELRDYINHNNNARPADRIEVIGYIDDDESTYEHYGFSEPYLGGIQDHKILEDAKYLMGIANLEYRKKIIETLVSEGAKFRGLIHPTAIISPSCVIHPTTVISHNASVGAKAEIGAYNMLNSRCTIGHDTKMGDYNFISPQVAISGNTSIGNENLIGTNACTIPGIKIGNNNKIAAGMVIYKPIENDSTVIFRHKERLIVKKE